MNGWHAGLSIGPEISYECDSGEVNTAEYMRIASTMLAKILPGDVIAWNGVDLSSGNVGVVAFPEQRWSNEVMAGQLADDHPLAVSYLRDTHDIAPRRLSDVASRSSFLRSRAYNSLYRMMGADQQITVLTSAAATGRLHCWAVNRLGLHR